MTPEHMAEIVSQAIDVAVAPLVSRLAVAEAQLSAYDLAASSKHVGDLRERVAVHEARTEPLLSKVAELDARPWVTKQLLDGMEATIAGLRTKMAELEARAPVPGPAGPVGEKGEQGLAGIGLPGPAGPAGPAGPQGEPGPMGLTGPAGAQGEKGDPGEKGADGLNGKDGAPGPQGEKGSDGQNGKDGSVGPQGQKGLDGAQGPAGERGADGLNGKDGAPGERGEKGIDGAAGLNGKDGRDGIDGKDGAPGPQGQKGLDGAHGKDGKDGLNGKDGAVGQAGEKGLDGRDGVGIAGALLGRDGDLVLTFTDGTSKSVGIVSGKDGAPGLNGKDADHAAILKHLSDEIDKWERPQNGKDGRDGLNGKDGFSLKDFSVAFDEAKGYRFCFKSEDLQVEEPIAVPFHAGIWQSGRSYVAGANVTAKGSTWTALAETHGARPGEDTPESRVWRLAVKRGADGKPGKDGKNGGGDE